MVSLLEFQLVTSLLNDRNEATFRIAMAPTGSIPLASNPPCAPVTPPASVNQPLVYALFELVIVPWLQLWLRLNTVPSSKLAFGQRAGTCSKWSKKSCQPCSGRSTYWIPSKAVYQVPLKSSVMLFVPSMTTRSPVAARMVRPSRLSTVTFS